MLPTRHGTGQSRAVLRNKPPPNLTACPSYGILLTFHRRQQRQHPLLSVATALEDGVVPAVQLSIRDSMELLRTRVCEWQPVGIDSLAIAPSGAGSSPRLAVGRESPRRIFRPILPHSDCYEECVWFRIQGGGFSLETQG